MENNLRKDLYLFPLAATYLSLGLSSDNLIQTVFFTLSAMITLATFMRRRRA